MASDLGVRAGLVRRARGLPSRLPNPPGQSARPSRPANSKAQLPSPVRQPAIAVLAQSAGTARPARAPTLPASPARQPRPPGPSPTIPTFTKKKKSLGPGKDQKKQSWLVFFIFVSNLSPAPGVYVGRWCWLSLRRGLGGRGAALAGWRTGMGCWAVGLAGRLGQRPRRAGWAITPGSRAVQPPVQCAKAPARRPA